MKRWKILLCTVCIGCTGLVTVHADEQFKSKYMTMILGLDSEAEIASVEPAFMIEENDRIEVWTSTDVLSDDALIYVVTPDVVSSDELYVAEFDSSSNNGNLGLFTIEYEDAGSELESKILRKSYVYSDEIVDCYFFDDNFYEHKVSVQLDGAKEDGGLYWANYEVIDKEVLDAADSVRNPGAVMDSYGNCVGLLCPKAAGYSDIILFAEPVEQEESDESEEISSGTDNDLGTDEEEVITTTRSRAGTVEVEAESESEVVISGDIESESEQGRDIGTQIDAIIQGWNDDEGEMEGVVISREEDVITAFEEENGEIDDSEMVIPDMAEGECWEENGNVYVGTRIDGTLHGYGYCVYESGEVYVGDWEYGKRTGNGKFFWTDGEIYSGSFVNGSQHGYGVYTWADGSRYSGDWNDGKRHGTGWYTDKNGNQEKRTYEYGERVE